MLQNRKPSPGEYLKCKNPENYFSRKELSELRKSYYTAINKRMWQAVSLPSCKKANSILEGKLLIRYLLKCCDRTMLCFVSFNEMAEATSMTNYRVRQLVKALQEINILSYSKSCIQLLPVPSNTPTTQEMQLRHFNERKGQKG